MKKHSLVIITSAVLLIIAAVAFAQQRGTPRPIASTPVTISGTVVSFSAGYGAGMPSLVVSDGTSNKTFVLGPFWVLQKASFAAAAGDHVTINAFACSNCANGYAVISVLNLTSGKELKLRDSSGAPLWQGRQRGVGYGPGGGMHGAGGNCGGMYAPDLTQKASFEGTIVSFKGGPGVGQPELTIATAAGEKTFILGPYHVVLASGYNFAPGSHVTVTAAPVDGNEWVVLTLKDTATGLELIFRDENGFPVRP